MGLGETYDDHLGLIGKRVGLPISVNWTFLLGVLAEALRANIGSKSAISLQLGLVDPKFQVEWVAPNNRSSSQKTRLNDLGMVWKSGQIFLPFCHYPRISQTDIQTDRGTAFSSLDRICIACSAVKTALGQHSKAKLRENASSCNAKMHTVYFFIVGVTVTSSATNSSRQLQAQRQRGVAICNSKQ